MYWFSFSASFVSTSMHLHLYAGVEAEYVRQVVNWPILAFVFAQQSGPANGVESVSSECDESGFGAV